MRASEITYGEARDVSDWLHVTDTDDIGQGDLVGALVNALNRIDALEKRLAKAEEQRSCTS